ncbi:MAG TPA: DUF4367 domain-containing protein [Candidatus Babeliales bacterium]|nr:DUF4367 domain-containing protein [Candidatus Babeliales bacterium]
MSTGTSLVSQNGQYDTAGKIISSSKAGNSTRHIDGFVKGPQKTNQHPVKSYDFHKRTEKAQTLMRSGLKKPAKQFHDNIQRAASAINIERQSRAKQTAKSPRVARFGVPSAKPNSVPNKANKRLSGELVQSRQPQSKSTVRDPAAPLPSMITSASHLKLERLLDEALSNANSHKEALNYHAARHFWQKRWFRGHRRWLPALAVFSILISGLIISWQRVPQLSIKFAGMKAHLSPTIPSYKPEGYAMSGPAQAVSGTVNIKYKSLDDESRVYEINQTPSNLTSSLVGQNVVPKGSPVQTSQVKGNTIYIYGTGNDAVWVNNGVLYKIKDRANLSSDELLDIVKGVNP